MLTTAPNHVVANVQPPPQVAAVIQADAIQTPPTQDKDLPPAQTRVDERPEESPPQKPAAVQAVAQVQSEKTIEPPVKSPTRDDTLAMQVPQNHSLGKLAQESFAKTQGWLKTAPGKSYAIQLITVTESEPARLESFLRRAQKLLPTQDLYVYSVKIDGVQHYRVAMGNYATTTDVRDAIADLPADLKVRNPYFRSVDRMRSQNSQ
jgi:hypothetical protein